MVSVSCFGVRVLVMFHFMFVIILLVQFGLLRGHLLGNSSASNLFSLYFVYLYYLFISRFGFKSRICLLIPLISITFLMSTQFVDKDPKTCCYDNPP